MTSTGQVVLNGDPVPSVAAYRAHGGGEGLRVARSLGPWRTAEEVTLSGLRGRGGGGFRTGRKWLSVLDAARDDERRFVVANAHRTGYHAISVDFEPSNLRSRPFWLGLGFQPTGYRLRRTIDTAHTIHSARSSPALTT
jgi:NADH:ubiquinone oxidoreductase subunit F (NADH-binding)